jgi:hypothetical protein
MMCLTRSLVALALLFWLGGCAVTDQRSAPAPVEDRAHGTRQDGIALPYYPDSPAPPKPAEQPRSTVKTYAYRAAPGVQLPTESNDAVVALLQTAEQQHRSGNSAAAAATLERALRIEPRNAVLWNRLAHVRFQQRRPGLAENLAAKSNALAAQDRDLMRDNWLLIGRARQAAGDVPGAEQARRKAQSL